MVQVKTTKFVWMDGKFVKWENANVHILTHALLYGSSVFEGVHAYKTNKGTAIFRLDDHIERLFYSAKALGMNPKFTKNALKNAIKDIIKINNLGDAYIRPAFYYGYGNVGVYPKNVPTNIAIIALPWSKYFSKNLRIMISKYIRHSEKSSVFGVKISGNYANSILAMHEARINGYDEALMLDYRNYVCEGPAENVFLVKNNKLMTPSSKSALHGITRGSILKLSEDLEIEAYEKNITLNEVKNADELFFCGTMMEIAPIISINNKKIGDGKVGVVTKKIRKKFYEAVRGNDNKHRKWLTYFD